MKTIAVLLTIIWCCPNAFSQKSNTHKSWKFRIKSGEIFKTRDFNDKDTVLVLARDILSIALDESTPKFNKDTSQLFMDDKKNNWAIIVAHNNFKHQNGAIVSDPKKVNLILLHKERKPWSSEHEWSEYLYHTRNILLITLGTTGLTPNETPIDLGIEINNKDSFFKNSAKELLEVIKSSFPFPGRRRFLECYQRSPLQNNILQKR
jgi:hypothetical protein